MSAEPLKIAMVSPEFFPLAKTGGLADVIGALSKSLAELGHQVKVFLPNYQMVQEKVHLAAMPTGPVEIQVGGEKARASLKSTKIGGNQSEILLVDCPEYFNRPDLYKDPKTGFDYPDNDERYIFFSRAVLEILEKINFQPDVIHTNEWQSAIVCAYLKTAYSSDPFFAKVGSLFSIHNLAYQGIFSKKTFDKLGLPQSLFYPFGFEFHGKINFLKTGVVFADVLNTVSENYAVEIQSSAEFGCGLEGVLRQRNNDLYGIVNGVDYSEWSPATDKYIPAKYDQNNLTKKKENKETLYKECGFSPDKMMWPALGMIGRLVDQKGLDLLVDIAEDLFQKELVLVVLGSGDIKYERWLKEQEKKETGRLKVFITFDERLAHLIEAGCDIFLMPSKYEPCGLNQLYSLRYGTVPVARSTGGLADTIQDFRPGGSGTGFLFKEYNSFEFWEAIQRALDAFQDKKTWEKLQRNGMGQDFSWEKAAQKYLELYHLAKKR